MVWIYYSFDKDNAANHHRNVDKIVATIAQDEWGDI